MSLQIKVDRVYLDVQKAHLASNLRTLIKLFSQHFQDISNDSSKFTYFNEVAEKHLYDNYSTVLTLNSRPFVNEFLLTDSDLDIFEKLKGKAMTIKFPSKDQPTESEMFQKLNFAVGDPDSALKQSIDL